MKSQRILISLIVMTALLVSMAGRDQAQGAGIQRRDAPQTVTGNAFTYQGLLKDGGNPVNGEVDFRFTLQYALTGDTQVGNAVIKDDVTVANGLFSVTLNFGVGFDGTGLWLEIGVRPGNSTGDYALLTPRQELTAAPFALYALNIPEHDHFGEYWAGSTANGLVVQNASSQSWDAALRGLMTADSGSHTAVIGENDSTTGTGVSGRATATGGATYGVKGTVASLGGYGGYFENSAGGTALYAKGAVQSTADTAIAFNPFDLRAWSGSVSAIPDGQGYVYFRASATGLQEVLLPVTLPTRVFGVAQKLKSIKVCYQLDDVDGYIDQTEAYFYSDYGALTYLFQDITDRVSTLWTCYTYTDSTPNWIESAVMVRLWLNYWNTGSGYDVVIGSITLTLTEN